MKKMRLSTSLLTLGTAAILFGYMNSTFAGKKCDEDPTHPSCGGGGADGYTAALIEGAFRFGAVDVTVNKKGNSWSSTVMLDMVRPDDGIGVPAGQDPWVFGDQLAWDDVFASCPELFSGTDVGSVTVSDDWSIDNAGPRTAGTAGSNIRIQLRDVSVPGFPAANIAFGLIGVIEEGNELPPDETSSLFTLTEFSLFGDGEPPVGCRTGNLPLLKDSVLEIKRK